MKIKPVIFGAFAGIVAGAAGFTAMILAAKYVHPLIIEIIGATGAVTMIRVARSALRIRRNPDINGTP